jgi:hypothetical protein
VKRSSESTPTSPFMRSSSSRRAEIAGRSSLLGAPHLVHPCSMLGYQSFNGVKCARSRLCCRCRIQLEDAKSWLLYLGSARSVPKGSLLSTGREYKPSRSTMSLLTECGA